MNEPWADGGAGVGVEVEVGGPSALEAEVEAGVTVIVDVVEIVRGLYGSCLLPLLFPYPREYGAEVMGE